MHNILDDNDLRETADYIESLSDTPDNTNCSEMTKYAARLRREINEGSEYNAQSNIDTASTA